MAKQQGSTVENQFTQGLVTEASGLNFPPKAVTETWNTRFNHKGNVTRRLGLDFEGGDTSVTASVQAGVTRSFLWRAVGSRGDINFLVLQSGSTLTFYEADSAGEFSGGVKSFYVNLQTYASGVSGVSVGNAEAGLSSGNGKLFINHPYCKPLYVEYDDATDTITTTAYKIFIRDMEGVDDGLSPGERPATLSNLHKYNLYNQGWDQGVMLAGYNNWNTPIQAWVGTLGLYPSNSELWWYARGANKDGKENISYEVILLISKASGFAPKGHYIYDAFNMNRVSKSGISGIPSTSSAGLRPSCNAFFAGRIWYSGVAHQDYQGKVYYTQILEGDEQIGACYQKNDPTSEQLSDLLDTDGGEIKVTGMGRVAAMMEVGNSLIIWANNGIWSISGSGSEGTGFVATSFSIRRLSNIGAETGTSFVDIGGAPIWWNNDAIWSLDIAQSTVQSLSRDTIQTFYNEEVPLSCRTYAQGSYNPIEQTVQWLFRSTDYTTTQQAFEYDRILEFNLVSKAFYPHKWDISHQKLTSIFCAENIRVSSSTTQTVTDSSLATVTDSALAAVTADLESNVSFASTKYRYVANSGTGATVTLGFIEEVDDTYVDFASRYTPGKNYDSYFVTGPKIPGEGQKSGNLEYITVFANPETDASAKVRGRWDWATSSFTGKWSTEQEVYSANRTNRDVNRKRILIRGSGPALQLAFRSVAGKPFDLLGWSTWESVDGTP